MKTKILIGLLVIIVLISGCVQEKEVIEEFIGPGESKTLEEYKDYCQKNPEECEEWCEKNPEICPEYVGPHKEEADVQEKEVKEEEFIGYCTLKEYKECCEKNPEECRMLCERSSKDCPRYGGSLKEEEPHKEIFVPETIHSGDLVIGGTEIIENTKYLQQGNVYINNRGKLVIKDSEFMLGRGDIPTIHANIFVSGSLEIENSSILPEPGTSKKMGSLAIVSMNRGGEVNIKNSPTKIHLLTVPDGAQLTMINSEMIFDIGGLLQIQGGNTKLIDSTIGALGLTVPANAHLDITGLKSGVCFESWDVHDMIPDANYNVILENSCILEDDFKGELEHGPFERGWLFFLDPTAHVRISDSELRKVFIELRNDNVKFENLKVGKPSSLKYRDIELNNIIIKGQWPFDLIDSDVTISNSDYLFLQPRGRSTLSLVNSHMSEFIPRDFFGTIIFENSLWDDAGEIIGDEPGHAMRNDFIIKGSLKMGPKLRQHLQWKDAQVTREYELIVKDEEDNPVKGALIKIEGKQIVSDNTGKVKFNLILDEFNYNKPKKLEVIEKGETIAEKGIDFFTETPIIIRKAEDSLMDAHAHLFDIRKIDELVQAMDQNNISKSVLFGGCGQNYLDKSTYGSGYDRNYNPPIAEAYNLYPERLYPCLSGFDPQDDRNVEYVESQLESGNFKCIGELYLIHCSMSGDNEERWCPGVGRLGEEYKTIADHPVMQQIWNLSTQYNAPVFFHYERWKQSDVEALYNMFEKYPKTKFVWLHFGHSPNLHVHENELARFSNVYYETEELSGFSQDMIRLFEKYPTRFLLGTDTGCTGQIVTGQGHGYSLAMSMHRQLLSKLSKETADNIAYKNLRRLFSD